MTTAPDDPTVRLETTPHARADVLTPGAMLGVRYRIVSLIGRGGMGEVYRADDLRLGQPVALKFLSRRRVGNEQLVYDEMRIGRQISHPNVCRLHDIAEVDGEIFITMEYVDGEDLASLLRRVGRLSSDKALNVARELCAGLAAAHEMRVVHRDLKPGNVMIDGRGRARITDFGLAVAEDERKQIAAGTPAYMAPEQLMGRPATVQSDIYALGLVLYEIFTGRRAFEATTVAAILEQQRDQKFARPSTIVADVPPGIEQAILRCLDPDPDARPTSVRELVRDLPALDPLAAAIAAGETPSAGIVAAAAEKGDLRPAVAWTLLALSIAGIVVAAALAPRTMLVSQTKVKPVDVMMERVAEILQAAGVAGTSSADQGSMYSLDRDRVRFLYRQSPTPMRPVSRALTSTDPPFTIPGMTMIRLDPNGHLVELATVPPRHDASPPRPAYDWRKLFAFARIDATNLIPTRSEWTARTDSDDKRAWLIKGSDARIEAASYRGLPVWFAIVEPAERAPERSEAAQEVKRIIEMVLLIVLPILVLFLAVKHLRRGSSDRRGALRMTMFFWSILFIASILRMHHPSGFADEWKQISLIIAEITFFAGQLWIAYIAIEPLLRRRWPEVLISWSRLLAGRWRDPMVGRDVLIGTVAGLVIGIAWRWTALAPNAAPLREKASALGSIRQLVMYLFYSGMESIFKSVFAVVLLLALRALVRRVGIAVTIAILLNSAYFVAFATGPMPVRIAYGLLTSVIVYGVVLRFGLLALVTAGYVVTVLMYLPLTLDTSSWYFPRSMLVVGVLASLTCVAFRIAVADRRWLPRVSM